MKTTIQELDDKLVAILEGSLDTAVAAETEKAMIPLYNVEGKDIIIDCTLWTTSRPQVCAFRRLSPDASLFVRCAPPFI